MQTQIRRLSQCHSVPLARTVVAVATAVWLLTGCDAAPTDDQAAAPANAETMEMAATAPAAEQEAPHLQRLTAVLAAQPDNIKARYDARHPKETLAFFGIEPGMTVIEGDPGGGWYSGILQAYLGPEGTLIGADYPMGVYELFNYYSDEELAEKANWSTTWPAAVSDSVENGAAIRAYALGSMPASMDGVADAVLLIRVLHNLADFEEEGAYFSSGLQEVYRALKPGGVLGIVQHSGPEAHSREWASGANGYLKKSFVIAALEEAGFVYEAESTINENPLDQPTEEESVWRLPPTSEVEDDALAEAYAAIGESNRMTLRFRKPADA